MTHIKSGYLKQQYNFTDISVLYRQKNGSYINLSDYEISSYEINESILELDIIDSQYALSLFNTYAMHKQYVCAISLSELLALANIKGDRFVKQVKSGTEAEGESIVALICAKKILNYRYGKCMLVSVENEEASYAFMRNNGRGNYQTVLIKKFAIN